MRGSEVIEATVCVTAGIPSHPSLDPDPSPPSCTKSQRFHLKIILQMDDGGS